MNQGRIWCVVHPTVGLPLFLGSVALTSLAVHASVMSHTTWMSNYWSGSAKKLAMETDGKAVAATDSKGQAFSMTVTPVPANGSAPASFVITVSPNASAVTTVADDASTAKPAAPAIRTASAD